MVEHPGSFGLPVRLTNDAGDAAVDLVLAVTLRASDGGVVEEREVVIPLLGPAEQTTIVAVFSEDPRTMAVEVATLSYLR